MAFGTLPAGTTYLVVELQSPEYDGSLIIVSGGETVFDQSFAQGVNVTAGTRLISDSGTNSAAFTNNHNEMPFTGLIVGSSPFVTILALALIVTILMLTAKARKRTEELTPLEFVPIQ